MSIRRFVFIALVAPAAIAWAGPVLSKDAAPKAEPAKVDGAPAPAAVPSGGSIDAGSSQADAAPPAPVVNKGVTAAAEEEVGRPESVEIQVRRLADQLAAGVASRKGQGRYDRWAVTPFSELGDDVKKRHLGEIVAEQVEGSLKRDHGFICVERMKLAKLVQEAALAQAGVIDEAQAPKLGELAGADLLVVGSVGLLGDTYVANIRAVDTTSAKVVAAASAKFHAAGLVALSSEAVVLRTKSDAVFRSLLIPGWGQFYNRQEQKGAMFMFLGGALIAGGATTAVLGQVAQSQYANVDKSKEICPESAARADCIADLRATANSRFSTTNILFISYGLLHLYNILDAYLFGYEPDASTKSLYGDVRVDWRPDGFAVRF